MHALSPPWRRLPWFADIFEGSIIRATRRLDELMQELTQAAKVIGDTDLAKRLEESNMTIRRDIMFAASLYI
jgi:ATP-dependent RNA helicase DOB1